MFTQRGRDGLSGYQDPPVQGPGVALKGRHLGHHLHNHHNHRHSKTTTAAATTTTTMHITPTHIAMEVHTHTHKHIHPYIHISIHISIHTPSPYNPSLTWAPLDQYRNRQYSFPSEFQCCKGIQADQWSVQGEARRCVDIKGSMGQLYSTPPKVRTRQ